MKDIDWSIAPAAATHYGSLKGRFTCWYWLDIDGVWRYLSDTYRAWELVAENRPASDLVERPVATVADMKLESPTLHLQWCGRIYRLPPIGSTVHIDKGDRIIWDAAEMFIGVDVVLVAAFMTGDTQMVVVEHPIEKQCCCFRADMVRTAEQISAEARKDCIDEMTKVIRRMPYVRDHYLAERLYENGFRIEIKDDQP